MKRTDRWVAALVTPALCLGFVADSRAELIDRGTYNGVKLIYDSALRITWLGDANWAKTSGFDPNGEMTWDERNRHFDEMIINHNHALGLEVA